MYALEKIFRRYGLPAMSFTSWLLIVILSCAPGFTLRGSVDYIKVTALGGNFSMFIGPFSACANNGIGNSWNCKSSFSLDSSPFLPPGLPQAFVAPDTWNQLVYFCAAGFILVFTVGTMFCLSFSEYPKVGNKLLYGWAIIAGFATLLISSVPLIVNRVWFGKSIDSFNDMQSQLGQAVQYVMLIMIALQLAALFSPDPAEVEILNTEKEEKKKIQQYIKSQKAKHEMYQHISNQRQRKISEALRGRTSEVTQ